MSIDELIDILAQSPGDFPVFIGDGYGGADSIREIRTERILNPDNEPFLAIIIE